MISIVCKDNPKKSIVTCLSQNSTPPMAKPTVRPTTKPNKTDLLNQLGKLEKSDSGSFNPTRVRSIYFSCNLPSREELRLDAST